MPTLTEMAEDMTERLEEMQQLVEAAHGAVVDALHEFGFSASFPAEDPRSGAAMGLENAQVGLYMVLGMLDPGVARDIAEQDPGGNGQQP